jgi:hypothetical protein
MAYLAAYLDYHLQRSDLEPKYCCRVVTQQSFDETDLQKAATKELIVILIGE